MSGDAGQSRRRWWRRIARRREQVPVAVRATGVNDPNAAFRTGGYGQDTQLLIGGVVFALLAVVALTAPWPPIRRGLPLAALASLVGYAVWTGLSTGWARVLDAVHGEVVFSELIDRLSKYEDPTDLAGIAYRQPDGMPFTNATAPIPRCARSSAFACSARRP